MVKAIIPWMGGKRRLSKHILPEIEGFRCYVEPFCGGASMFFMKEPSPVEVINDLNGELVNLYRVVKYHLDELVRHFRWALVSREAFLEAKDTDPAKLTDVQRAARFYYLMKTCFGAKPSGQTFGTSKSSPARLNLLRMEEDLSSAHLRLARTTIEHQSWEKCINTYDGDETCFFLDPPYWQLTGYGSGFDFFQYETMADLMRQSKGKVVLSINDHPDIRRVFEGLRMIEVGITYTVGGGKAAAGELIITNR